MHNRIGQNDIAKPDDLLHTKSKLNRPTPWFDRYKNINLDNHVIIIGGGISGAATAYSLAKLGYRITLYDENNSLASSASGNYQAILYGNFQASMTPIMELSLNGYPYSHNLIKTLLTTDWYGISGLVQLAQDKDDIKNWQNLIESKILPEQFCQIVSPKDIEKLAGIRINCQNGLYFADGLWFHPLSLIKKLVDLPNINIVLGHKIDDIYYDNSWKVVINETVVNSASNLVLCNAENVNQFTPTRDLSIRKIRGQISIVKDQIAPKIILCGKGYVTPQLGDYYTIGATFDFKNLHNRVTVEDHLRNIRHAQEILPELESLDTKELHGQAAIRASTYDYMPLVGPLAKYKDFKEIYAKLSKDSNFWITDNCPYHHGLFLNVAHGAKGMLTAPICGELIASYIDNRPLLFSEKLQKALHPNRLYVRQLVKGKL